VRKLVLSRWAMVLLLVGRLVLGEFAHGMTPSHAHPESAAVSASSEHPDCQQHESTSTQADSQAAGASSSPDAHHDCCKSGACQCPCMHVPAVVVATFSAISIQVDHQRIMSSANGFACDRLWSLFRPPA